MTKQNEHQSPPFCWSIHHSQTDHSLFSQKSPNIKHETTQTENWIKTGKGFLSCRKPHPIVSMFGFSLNRDACNLTIVLESWCIIISIWKWRCAPQQSPLCRALWWYHLHKKRNRIYFMKETQTVVVYFAYWTKSILIRLNQVLTFLLLLETAK
jgi:hypothetical protein